MMPLVIITLLLVVSAVLGNKKWKRRLFVAGIVALLFFSNEFIANEVMRLWEVPATPYADIKKNYTWAILLTGVARAGLEPDDRVYFQRGADRVTHTVQLYKLGLIKKVMVSGGSGRLLDIGEREAGTLSKALILMGVNPEDIAVEDESRNTHESAVAVKKLLDGKARPEECLLVTSGYHIRRSLGCFNKVGWAADPFSTDFLTHPRIFTFDVLFIPKIEALTIWHHLIKETMGYISYVVVGYI